MEKIFDTHAHYTDSAFDEDRETLISSLRDKNVSLVMQACTDLEDAVKIQALADRFDFMYGSAGVHPENMGDSLPEDLYDRLKKLAEHKKVLAIGEIVLDYHYEGYDRQAQIRLFRMQLELARELSLPVIVHSRDATEDCMNILREYKPKGVMHCFSGSAETAREVVSLGMYIGFTGVLTFKNAKKALRALEAVPEDRLVLETDCPYMAPEPHRGTRNDSSNIPFIIEKIAEIKGISKEDVERITEENAYRLFTKVKKEKNYGNTGKSPKHNSCITKI